MRKAPHGMDYCGRDFRRIPTDPLPNGFFLVHNNGAFCDHGFFGFRAWVQKGDDNLIPCHCDFGGLRTKSGRLLSKEEIPKHYKVRPRPENVAAPADKESG